jgi:hypothetical protein
MSIIKKADRLTGISLRWFFNLITGNYFIHQERRVLAEIKKLEASLALSMHPLHSIHDRSEIAALSAYKMDLK